MFPKPCKCDRGYFNGFASLFDVRVLALWAAEMALRLAHKIRVLQGAADMVFCDQEKSTIFCDCPLYCEKVKPHHHVENLMERLRLIKCCPYKFSGCCECTGGKKKSCVAKCLAEKVSVNMVSGGFEKSHLILCGFACQFCDRDYWPENEQAMCPVADDLWRRLRGGANPKDKKKMMPLWMLRVARHALNLQFWRESKQDGIVGDDGRDCFTTGMAEDSKSIDKEVKSKDDLDQKEAEDNNLQSEDGKAGLSQAKDLLAQARKAESSHNFEDADALMVQAVELSDAAREGDGGNKAEKLKKENLSWLRQIIKKVNKGAKQLKSELGSSKKTVKEVAKTIKIKGFSRRRRRRILEILDVNVATKLSDRIEKIINHLVNEEYRYDGVQLRNTLRHVYNYSPLHKNIIESHGQLIEKLKKVHHIKDRHHISNIVNILGSGKRKE
jgi:hypothetical protein